MPSSNASARSKLVRADDDSDMSPTDDGKAPWPTDVIGQPLNSLSDAHDHITKRIKCPYSKVSDKAAKMPDGTDSRLARSYRLLHSDQEDGYS